MRQFRIILTSGITAFVLTAAGLLVKKTKLDWEDRGLPWQFCSFSLSGVSDRSLLAFYPHLLVANLLFYFSTSYVIVSIWDNWPRRLAARALLALVVGTTITSAALIFPVRGTIENGSIIILKRGVPIQCFYSHHTYDMRGKFVGVHYEMDPWWTICDVAIWSILFFGLRLCLEMRTHQSTGSYWKSVDQRGNFPPWHCDRSRGSGIGE